MRWTIFTNFLISLLIIPQAGWSGVCTYIGGGGDSNWSTAANWDCGIVPGMNDTAILNSKTVILDIDTSIMRLEMRAPTGTCKLEGGGSLTISGDFLWEDSGNLGSGFDGGSVMVQGRAFFFGSNFHTKNVFNKSIILNGGAVQTGASFQLQNNTTFIISQNTIYDIQNDLNARIWALSGSIINNGTIKRTKIGPGPNPSSYEFRFIGLQNNDSIIVEAGYLTFNETSFVNSTIEVVSSDNYVELEQVILDSTHIQGDGYIVKNTSATTTVDTGTTIDTRVIIDQGKLLNNTDLTLAHTFLLRSTVPIDPGKYVGAPGSQLTLNGKSIWQGPSNIEGEGMITCNDTCYFSGSTKRFFSNPDDMIFELNHVGIWESGKIEFQNNVSLVNNNEFILVDTPNLELEQLFSITPSQLINNDTLIREGNNELISNLAIENNGVILGTGTITQNEAVISGTGTINPGFSPGLITLDGEINLTGGLEFEVDDDSGPGAGHDQILVDSMIHIGDAHCVISGMLNIPNGQYTLLFCNNGPGCYEGTFDTTYLDADLRLDFLDDRIDLVKGPRCINTWKVDALLLATDPHQTLFESSNRVISNGSITNGENVTFSGAQEIDLLEGFEVEGNAVFNAIIDGCVQPE